MYCASTQIAYAARAEESAAGAVVYYGVAMLQDTAWSFAMVLRKHLNIHTSPRGRRGKSRTRIIYRSF